MNRRQLVCESRWFGLTEVSTCCSSVNPPTKKFFVCNPLQRERGSVPQATGTGTLFARDQERIKGTIPMPTFARRPMTMSSLFPVDIPQNSVVGQQRQQISELQFDKFPTPSSFLLEDPILKTIDYLF